MWRPTIKYNTNICKEFVFFFLRSSFDIIPPYGLKPVSGLTKIICHRIGCIIIDGNGSIPCPNKNGCHLYNKVLELNANSGWFSFQFLVGISSVQNNVFMCISLVGMETTARQAAVVFILHTRIPNCSTHRMLNARVSHSLRHRSTTAAAAHICRTIYIALRSRATY